MKGVYIFIGILLVSAVFCGVLPFVLMPSWGVSMALPVVSVPGEVLQADFLGISGFNLTNTIIGTLLADIVMLAFALGATRKLSLVPGRLQGLFEVLTDILYGMTKSTAGQNAKKLFPLIATIFLFLLLANWLELIPGVDSVGLMHCAEEGVSGYERDGWHLKVDQAMYTGEKATEENYELCHAKEAGHVEENAELDFARAAALEAAAANLGVDQIDWKDDVGNGNTLASYITGEGGDVEAVYATTLAQLEAEYGSMLEGEDAASDAETTEGEAAEAETTEAEATEAEATEGAEAEGHAESEVPATPEGLADAALNDAFYRDDIYVVTPFVRAAATDLNLTLGLALFAFFVIQFFGVQSLGVSYFAKFINTPALGNLGKKPMGAMDFVVGLLEIISELSRIISFAFRLFGNIFAGQMLLFIIPFLAGVLLPLVVYGFEMFVGVIQAYVFAMLVLVFSSMAMAGHDHDEAHE